MKKNLIRLLGALAVLMAAANANAIPLIFQGSSDPSGAVTMTPAEARTAWEAELQSFQIDTLTGTNSSAPFTTPAGFTYSETGNGSSISWTGSDVYGRRNSAPFIQFDVTFPSFVNAVGFDVYDNDGGTMDLYLTDAFTNVVTTFSLQSTPGSGDREFFGVVFDTSTFISALRVSGTDPGGITSWDNFTTGVGANVVVNPNNPVPAPAPLLLLGLGLAVMGSLRTRQSNMT
ncbi:hypothetical protein [Sedimenticola selenatireducens]|uniref:PEP-CTERM sorting domain-containing protein n=1 Tax=Sedimenticola selenatireducens TaxID=191960 RepID=A0A557SAB4_9GAMM|nr:hypothetical protein [Sedimenticola selenatireducens]TVO74261.1 hypothetical protein FHP88_10870 [Sedimenticola selenatireducens]TVT62591.1 MAG: hypothetical protein FHK78_14530 [Sedimenticola selenatireducens]